MNILQAPNALFFLGLVVQFGIRHHFIQQTKLEKKSFQQVDGIEKALLAAVLSTALLLPPIYCFTPILSFADYDPGISDTMGWRGNHDCFALALPAITHRSGEELVGES